MSGSKTTTTTAETKKTNINWAWEFVSQPVPATDAKLQLTKFCEVDLYQQHKDSSLQTKERGGTANKGTVPATQKGDAVNKKL
jgi:hypothetical protein